MAWLGLFFSTSYKLTALEHVIFYRGWFHFIDMILPPYARERGNHLNNFCRLLGSNPGRLRSKRVLYPFRHCLSGRKAADTY